MNKEIVQIEKDLSTMTFFKEEAKRYVKELKELLAQCNIKKKELEILNSKIKRAKVPAEEKDADINKAIVLRYNALKDLDTTIAQKKLEVTSANERIIEVKKREERVTDKEREVLALEASLFTKESYIKVLVENLENQKAQMVEDETAIYIKNIKIQEKENELSLRENDIRKAEEQASKLIADAKRANDLSLKKLADSSNSQEDSAVILARIEERDYDSEQKNKQIIEKLAEADRLLREAKSERQDVATLKEGLDVYSKHLDEKKLRLDAIIKRKNIDEKKLGSPK